MALLEQFKLQALYNQLMNQRQYAACALLSDEQLHSNQKAFFKSVFGTLNHILVADIVWLKRFESALHLPGLAYLQTVARPAALNALLFADLSSLKAEREKIDVVLLNWIDELIEADLDQCIAYHNMAGVYNQKQLSKLLTHLFLHQVHHRGQVTTLLSQFDVDFGETDLIELIESC